MGEPLSHSETASESSLEPLESEEETHDLEVEMFPEIPMAHVGVLSPNPRKRTPRHPSTKAIFAMGFMAVVGLLSVSYTINRHGHLVPTALLRQPPSSFGFFLAIIMIIFYCAAIAMIVQEVFPSVFRVLNLIAFVLLVLGVTVLLWSLIPNNFCWVPWLLFSCTVMAALGVMIHERFERVLSFCEEYDKRIRSRKDCFHEKKKRRSNLILMLASLMFCGFLKNLWLSVHSVKNV